MINRTAAMRRAGRRSHISACVLCAAAIVTAGAAEPASVSLRRLDGTAHEGFLLHLGEGAVAIASRQGSTPSSFPFADCLALDVGSQGSDDVEAQVHLEFANGDRVAANVRHIVDDLVTAEFHGGELVAPVEVLRGVILAARGSDETVSTLLLRDRGADDLILFTNGDRLVGEFIELSATELTLAAGGRETRVPRERIAAILFAPDLTAPATIEGPRQIVQSTAGWLTVRDLARQPDGGWSGQAAFDRTVRWPPSTVRRILFAGNRVVFLSELEPSQVEQRSFWADAPPLRRDRDTTGAPLAAAGRQSPKGLGTHSRSEIDYDLGGRYVAFHAITGLARSAGETGSVEFKASVDGRSVFQSGPIDVAMSRAVTLDLSGVSKLRLTVDYGRNGDILDRANWCEAILIRKP